MRKEDLIIGKTYEVKGEKGTYHRFYVGDKVEYI